MSQFLKEIAETLNIVMKSRFYYHNDKVIIRIHKATFYPGDNDDRISVIDINNKYKLDNYRQGVFYHLLDKNIKQNFEDDKYIYHLLIRIVADMPLFLKRKEELEYFDICKNQNSINFFEEDLNIFDCEVFHFTSISEERKIRNGKDDIFYITTINSWHIKYNKAIIKNDYLQSLLPEVETNIIQDSAYAATIIGEETKSFKIDTKQTKILHDSFSMEKYLEYIKENRK
jgi:hypothetical protein